MYHISTWWTSLFRRKQGQKDWSELAITWGRNILNSRIYGKGFMKRSVKVCLLFAVGLLTFFYTPLLRSIVLPSPCGGIYRASNGGSCRGNIDSVSHKPLVIAVHFCVVRGCSPHDIGWEADWKVGCRCAIRKWDSSLKEKSKRKLMMSIWW